MDSSNLKEENKDENKLPKDNSEFNLSLVPYVVLAVLRVVLTVIPQTGYIQPDEYFQSIEIVNGKKVLHYLNVVIK